jgi:acetyl esterase/lipase
VFIRAREAPIFGSLCVDPPQAFGGGSMTYLLTMLSALLLLSYSGSLCVMAAAMPELKVWPGIVPGEASYTPPDPAPESKSTNGTFRIALVTEPTITFYPAANELANGTTVLVCPGGGYNILAYDKEGTEIAEWLNTIGVHAAVLKYRVPRRGKEAHVAPLQDAQRALRLLRKNAVEWHINPKAIGVLGFSAGGHLTVMTGIKGNESAYEKQDAIDELSCRPDFLIPIYPAYLGDEKTPGPLSPLIQVSKDTPATFIAVTHDDALRGINAASLYIELKKFNVPAELHIYTKGGHGYGMRPSENPVHTWTKRCEEWLRAMALIK